jgi:PAS domain-containing protein
MRHSRTGRGAATYPGPPYTQEVELAWLDRAGMITAVNSAWCRFCADGDPTACGPGVSYLEVCDADPRAAPVAAAIRAQLGGSQVHPVVLTVPGDGPQSARWHDVHISPRIGETGEVQGVVIAERGCPTSRGTRARAPRRSG